ncbi:hypothetical protein [Coxiella endosymbiont of Rhipicephalus microplus]|uniref:hypothetical protein n=1 Tax=Coxiella endosymbiont of Rhipicephalus microplus TaxID=1656186 RepID=UPI001F3BCBA4
MVPLVILTLIKWHILILTGPVVFQKKRFVESFGLEANEYTTQIEPHDRLSELLQSLIRLNNILIDCCRRVYGAISVLGIFIRKL